MEIQATTPDEVRALLAENDLPTDDLGDPALALFAARHEGELVGAIGLQTCDHVGLLRSLAVGTTLRNRGIGEQLCRYLLKMATSRGVSDLYLLTTSAADYFTRFGFIAIDRGDVPPAIRATTQFGSLCPSSAIVMRCKIA